VVRGDLEGLEDRVGRGGREVQVVQEDLEGQGAEVAVAGEVEVAEEEVEGTETVMETTAFWPTARMAWVHW
jgi:hypothetical protein